MCIKDADAERGTSSCFKLFQKRGDIHLYTGIANASFMPHLQSCQGFLFLQLTKSERQVPYPDLGSTSIKVLYNNFASEKLGSVYTNVPHFFRSHSVKIFNRNGEGVLTEGVLCCRSSGLSSSVSLI